MEEILTLQGEVAADIVRGVEVELTPMEQEHLAGRGTIRPDVYDAYLRGMEGMLGARGDWDRAIAYFEETIERDPLHAQAHAALAQVLRSTVMGGGRSPQQRIPRAKKLAEKAVDLDPTLAEAHAIRGALLLQFDWNREAARNAFEKAVSLNPSSVIVRREYFIYLLSVGKIPGSSSGGSPAPGTRPQVFRAPPIRGLGAPFVRGR